jgi:dipeptidyl aminopeptidase/acylaminoacyl peptidase
MSFHRIGTTLVCFALAVFFAGAATAAPLDAYGRLPALEDLAISPNGKVLASVKTDAAGHRVVVVETLDTHQLLTSFAAGTDKLRGVAWADDDKLLITISNAVYTGWTDELLELYVTVSYSLKTGQTTDLLKDASWALHVVAGDTEARSIGGKTMLFVPGFARSGLRLVLAMYMIDPETGTPTQIDLGNKYTTGYEIDAAGNLAARIEYDESRQHWSLNIRRNGEWVEGYGVDASIETPEVLGWTPDGASLLVAVIDGDKRILKPFNVAAGTFGPPIDPGTDISGTLIDTVSQRMIGGIAADETSGYVFLKPADQAAWNRVKALFPGERASFESWNADRSRIVVRVDGPRDGTAYRLVDLAANSVTPLGDAYAGIGPDDIAPVTLVHYKTADGLVIPAYLTLPRNRPAKNLSLIVMPHGGPAARDMPGFDWWAQALASVGYAVLQPEFRGSDGFGWSLLSAGFGEWGRKMQTDLSDGIRYLADQGMVDPARVCIVGASYGGYAALAGATLQHGIYRCAVSVAGLSDPGRLLGGLALSRNDDSNMRYLERYLGARRGDSRLAEIAPLEHASEADIPILLFHGTDDTVVPFEQTSLMNDALYHHGKQVQFYSLTDQDHWLSRGQTRLLMLKKIVEFLEAVNAPG